MPNRRSGITNAFKYTYIANAAAPQFAMLGADQGRIAILPKMRAIAVHVLKDLYEGYVTCTRPYEFAAPYGNSRKRLR